MIALRFGDAIVPTEHESNPKGKKPETPWVDVPGTGCVSISAGERVSVMGSA